MNKPFDLTTATEEELRSMLEANRLKRKTGYVAKPTTRSKTGNANPFKDVDDKKAQQILDKMKEMGLI